MLENSSRFVRLAEALQSAIGSPATRCELALLYFGNSDQLDFARRIGGFLSITGAVLELESQLSTAHGFDSHPITLRRCVAGQTGC